MANQPLYSPAHLKTLLARYKLRADKAFGQNFLIDGNILRAIVAAAELDERDTVLEIGPGLGVLTRELAERAARVISVELDARLLPVLAETLADYGNIELVHADGLEFDLNRLPERSLLVANLPYNVATPLLTRALESGRFKRLVFLVQREVAERLVAEAGDKQFGALSLWVRHFGEAHIIRQVKPGAFFPPPEVTSSIVRIDVRSGVQPRPELFAFIHLGFKHRRKTLKKNLLMAGYEETRVLQTLSRLQLDPRVRAEKLELEQFKILHRLLDGP